MADPLLVLLDPSAPDGLRVAPEGEAALRVTDLGVTRGDGVFETIGVFDGRAQNVGPHLDRLERSAGMIDLVPPARETLEAAIERAIREHEDVADLGVRVIVTRGPEGENTPTAWVHAKEWPLSTAERTGLHVVTLDRGVSTTAPASSPWLLLGAKTLSYAVNMAASREAARRGADDVLFVSSDGYALEGPTSTLLVRRGDRFSTTPAEAGVLPGTSLAAVVTRLREQGQEVHEELLTVEDVRSADAAWLLSSVRRAAPIRRLDDTDLNIDEELTATLSGAISGRS
ncbi:aminotransferase class IV [Brachybacterium sp. EF45031]|uniref:aminotransferase class IV n=1 Tax=Brachybacterium sillae TaxID=2810536 RepID=UPI00217CFC8A|nr:aminotransferase class IV [Brachybacterium sillae]MCS6711709.1 aminotransferase class IV [Brachybacterium sillae]